MTTHPNPDPTEPLPDDVDSPTEQPHIVASWLVRVHARGAVEPPTLDELKDNVRGSLEEAYQGLAFTVYPERIDR